MGFAWTEDISVGASADPVDILEIRTNVDTVDDEKCLDDENSYDLDDNDGDDTTHNPGYCNDDNGTYRNDDHGHYHNNEYGTYLNNDQNGARTPRWSAD